MAKVIEDDPFKTCLGDCILALAEDLIPHNRVDRRIKKKMMFALELLKDAEKEIESGMRHIRRLN